tara:strand:+ start:13 stop:312 length:300 start_codon:yes stop_codon:yes gene_type:complete
MAYKVTNVWARENTSIDWYRPNTDQKNHFTSTYDNTGKRTSATSTESADELTLTNISVFANSAAKTDWDDDSTCSSFREARKTYYRNNGVEYVCTIDDT